MFSAHAAHVEACCTTGSSPPASAVPKRTAAEVARILAGAASPILAECAEAGEQMRAASYGGWYGPHLAGRVLRVLPGVVHNARVEKRKDGRPRTRRGVIRHIIRAEHRAIWASLASFTNADGEAWPARTTLAIVTGYSVETVTRALAEGERPGVFEPVGREARGVVVYRFGDPLTWFGTPLLDLDDRPPAAGGRKGKRQHDRPSPAGGPVDERLGLAEADRPRVGRELGRALLLVRYGLTAMAYLTVIDKLVWVTIEAAGLIAEHPSGPIGVNAQPADVTGNPLERALEALGRLIEVRHLAGDSGDEAYRS